MAELIAAQTRELLNLRRLPAVLTAAQTAALLDGGGGATAPASSLSVFASGLSRL